jgi:hypothetical protein
VYNKVLLVLVPQSANLMIDNTSNQYWSSTVNMQQVRWTTGFIFCVVTILIMITIPLMVLPFELREHQTLQWFPPQCHHTTIHPTLSFLSSKSSESSSSSSSLPKSTSVSEVTPPIMTNDIQKKESLSIGSISSNVRKKDAKFDLSLALLCSGLAFDAYVEPDKNSSRWERGSSGVDVAFCSIPYTRSLYRGLVEFTIQKITHLPSISENDSTAERIISGDGIDAYVLAAILEGQWTEDIQKIENEPYLSPNGIFDVTGAAHVSRTSTCWSTITKEKSELSYQKKGIMLPYHVPAPSNSLLNLFNNDKDKNLGSQAIWPENELRSESPIYLYVQDPSAARIVLTVMDDDRIVLNSNNNDNMNVNTNGRPVGLTYKKLTELIPQAGWTPTKYIQEMKQRVLKEIEQGQIGSSTSIDDIIRQKIQETTTMNFVWEGSIPLLRKPRKQDKGNQRLLGAVAGAAIAGPMGAATGAVLASLYESPVSGQIHCKIKYTPLPPPLLSTEVETAKSSLTVTKSNKRTTYIVKGGTPGIDWGTLYTKYQLKNKISNYDTKSNNDNEKSNDQLDDGLSNYFQGMNSDLEHCFFVSHRKTGATCAVYRSIQYKYIVVSFRGTCAPVDLITDASLIQETWIEGEDENIQILPKVHVGFRSSMNSISRRLKELILAIPAPGDSISQYDMFVTGHSLGGALSTLFTADIGQYGIDAGRGLPQIEQSEPWWNAVVNTFTGSKSYGDYQTKDPPRPKSLRMYNFGSPRVGNVAFAELFDALCDEGHIDQAYRIVNGDDVVARLPRTVNALVFGNINYEHVGTTVLLTPPESDIDYNECNNTTETWLWVEGESDDSKCPVRDGEMLISPMAEGTLLNDLITATREGFAMSTIANATTSTTSNGDNEINVSLLDRLSAMAGKVTARVMNMKASDIASIIGIDQSFTDRELRIIQSLLQGNALAHHLEDQYYAGMGRASGFIALVNEEIVEMPFVEKTNELD